MSLTLWLVVAVVCLSISVGLDLWLRYLWGRRRDLEAELARKREEVFRGTPLESPFPRPRMIVGVAMEPIPRGAVAILKLGRLRLARALDVASLTTGTCKPPGPAESAMPKPRIVQEFDVDPLPSSFRAMTPDEQIDAYLAAQRCDSCHGEGCPDCASQ